METSDDDVFESKPRFYYWNNWTPKIVASTETHKKGIAIDIEKYRPIIRHGHSNWLPPLNQKSSKKKNFKKFKLSQTSSTKRKLLIETGWNNDWGNMFTSFNSFSNVDEECFIWGIFSPGIFGYLKVSVNLYGNIQVLAQGQVNGAQDDMKGVFYTNSEEHVRKLLGISAVEWVALVESVKETQENLLFEANNTYALTKLSPLGKLWYGVCMRRHYLPHISLRLRRSGVQKLTNLLIILPKFSVESVRTFDGHEIE